MTSDTPPRLIGGPYTPPAVPVGGVIFDVARGPVTIARMSTARIPWPVARGHGNNSLVLCGGLLHAVATESGVAIMWWFGASQSVVSRWRSALGVGRLTPGSLIAYRSAGAEIAARPNVRRSFGAYWDARRAVALSTPEWIARSAAAAVAVAGDRQDRTDMRWRAEEEALLGLAPDDAVASAVRRSRMCVTLHRRRLGIASWRLAPPSSRLTEEDNG